MLSYNDKLKLLDEVGITVSRVKSLGLDPDDVSKFLTQIRKLANEYIKSEAPLTVLDVEKLVDGVRAVSDDPERADGLIRHLFSTVLQAITIPDCKQPHALANAALAALEIELSW